MHENFPRRLLHKPITLLFPAVVVFILFSGVLSNQLVWDDIIAFENTSRYRDISHAISIFFEPLIFSERYYRPLTSLTFILQNHFFGLSATGLHLVSLFLHSINTLLVTLLCWQLAAKWDKPGNTLIAPIIAGAFYGLHPAMIEAVAFASTRFDLLMTTFVLLAMLSTLVFQRNSIRAITTGFCFLMAALAKEMALGFAISLPLWLLLAQPEPARELKLAARQLVSKNILAVIAAVFVAGLAYLILRYAALHGLLPGNGPIGNAPASVRLTLITRSALEYLSMILVPFGNISPAHPVETPFDPNSLRNLASAIAFPVILVAIGLLVRTQLRIGLVLAMGILALVPVLGLAPLSRPADMYFSESYLPMPMIFFALGVFTLVGIVEHGQGDRRKLMSLSVYSIVATWLLASCFIVVSIIPLWKNEVSFWTWVSTSRPELSAPRLNLGVAYMNAGNSSKALSQVNQVLEQDPGNGFGWNLRGKLLRQTPNKKESLDSHYHAVTIEPNNIDYWMDLAVSLVHFKEPEPASQVLIHEVLKRDPSHWRANAQLGFIYLERKQATEALMYLENALQYAPPGAQRTRIEQSVANLKKGVFIYLY